jgi:hypothetical protein
MMVTRPGGDWRFVMTVDATYVNGTLRLEQPLPLREHERVRVTVEPAGGRARKTAGLIGWKGDAEMFDRLYAEADERLRCRSA